MDSLGNVVNQYDFPPDTERYVRDLQKTSTGDIVGVGYVDMLDLGLGGWVFAMSQEGELLWSRDINDLRLPGKWGRFNAVQESENGGLIISGFILDTVENNPMSSVSNIWLVKLDSLGCLEPGCGDVQIISGSAEAQVPNKPTLFRIYPNPARSSVYFQWDLPNGVESATISISDFQGKLLEVLEIAGQRGKQEWSAERLEHGIYIYHIKLPDGNFQTSKLVIIK